MTRVRSLIAMGLLGLICVDVYSAPMDALSQRLAKGATGLKNKKVAILAFPYHDGKFSSGSTIVSERITTLLIGHKDIRVIERRLIKQLLAEKKLSETGVMDQESLRQMGAVLNVDALVTGTLIDLSDDQTEINARMIRTDSGEVLAAATETIERTWNDAPSALRREKKEEPVKSKPRKKRAEETAQAAPAPAKSGKVMKLSNESFAPGRRRYNADKPTSSMSKQNKYYDEKSINNAYGSGYDEGYYEAQLQSLLNSNSKSSRSNSSYGNSGNSSNSSGYNSGSSYGSSGYGSGSSYSNGYNNGYGTSGSYSTGNSIQHPTSIGVIRSENNPYGYSNTTYRRPKSK